MGSSVRYGEMPSTVVVFTFRTRAGYPAPRNPYTKPVASEPVFDVTPTLSISPGDPSGNKS